MKPSKETIISSAIIAGLLLTTCSGAALAANSSAAAQSAPTQQISGQNPGEPGGRGGRGKGAGSGFGSALFGGLIEISQGSPASGQKPSDDSRMETLTAALVSKGIVSQSTADKMIAFEQEKETERTAEMEKIKAMTEEERKAYSESRKSSASGSETTSPQERGGKGNSLTEMVSAGILTQAEADTISEYQKTQAESQQSEREAAAKESLNKELQTLVSKGLLTEDKATALMNYYTNQQSSRQAEMEKIKAMTEEERKAYFETQKDQTGTKNEIGAELVEAGILTQDEVNALKNYYQEKSGAERQETINEQLSSLVSAGTITSDAKEKITSLLNTQEKPAQRDTAADFKPAAPANPLQSLIDDGTLTKDQADAVCKAIFHMGRGLAPADASSNESI